MCEKGMHVVQIIDLLKFGGAQKLLVLLAAALGQSDVRLTVVSLRDDLHLPIAHELRALGVRVVAMPLHGLKDLTTMMRLARWIRRENVDLIHAHLTTANIVGGVVGRLTGVPVIASLHSSKDIKNSKVYRWVEGLALRYGMQRVIAVGQAVAQAHRARLKREPLIIPNGIASLPVLTHEERRAVRRELGVEDDQLLLIAVGRLSPEKGYDDLLTAFADVRQAYPQAVLAIVGAGSQQAHLEQRRQALGLTQAVRLTGGRSDVPRLLGASDLFVSAAHTEGLPVTLLEALSSGLPVVVTAVGDMPMVVNQEIGMVVPPRQPAQLASAICTLLGDDARRQQMGLRARSHVAQHYSVERWCEQLRAVYREVSKRPVALAHAHQEVRS